jgi:hypothetical protein
MAETGIDIENDKYESSAERADLEASLAEAKVRFSKTLPEFSPPSKNDLASTPPLAPVVSEQARELQYLKTQLYDAERMALRAQKAASDYREQLTEAQADIAAMKTRWYAAEKARNAVSSQREVDSSTISNQLVRAQRELERAQQMARSDMERAASRIQVLEERLEKAQTIAAQAESSQLEYRKRSHIFLSVGIAMAVVFGGVTLYRFLPHSAAADSAQAETATLTPGGSRFSSGARRQFATANLDSISKKPFVPHAVTKSLPDALGRLDRALKGFPGLDQEAVLHQVQVRQSTPGHPVCSFEWTNGQPSIVFGQGKTGANAENWAVDISRCADALEQAH